VKRKIKADLLREIEQLRAANPQQDASSRQIRAAEQQLRAANQQLEASNQQLRATEQHLRAANQQLEASNQQLTAAEQQLRAANQQLEASNRELTVTTGELRKRDKELTCLHGVSQLIAKSGQSGEGVIAGVVDVLPAGWQYPEITCARITVAGQESASANFRETAWQQTAEIAVEGASVGTVEVGYLAEKPELDEGPFLENERRLIDDIARQLARMVHRRRVEQRTRDLARFPSENPQPVMRIAKDGTILYANAAAEALLTGRGSATGRAAPERWRQQAAEARVAGRPQVFEVADGERTFEFSLVPVAGADYVNCYGLDITDRKAAEESAREAGRLNEQIIASAREGIIVYGPDLRYLVWNPFMEQLTGVPASEVLGRHPLEVFPFLQEAGVIERLEKALAGEAPDTVDFPYGIPETGRKGWASDTRVPLRNAQGEVVGVIGTVRDITERRQANLALELSAQRWQMTFDGVADAVCLLDRNMIILQCNRAAAEFAGRPAAEFAGRACWELFHGVEGPLPNCPFRRSLHSGRREIKEMTVGDRHLRITVDPLLNEAREVTGAVHTVSDVTEQKRAEEKLRQYEQIVSSTTDMLALIDRRYVYLAANAAYCQAFAKAPDEVIGRTMAEVLGEELFSTVVRPRIERCLAGEEVRYRDWFDFPAAGRKYMDVAYSPRFGPDAEVDGSVVTARDITERRRLEAQYLQAQKMEAVGQLAGGVAHDFRNQLQVIKGFGSMLLRRGLVADQGREKMAEILAAADRSARLTGQLLAFSRREMLRPEVIDPVEPVRDLQKSLPQMIGEDIRLLVHVGHDADCVNVDPGQFQQAVFNLAVNARDAMPRGGELVIGIEGVDLDASFVAPHGGAAAGRYAMVSVRDTGVGMDAKTRAQVFEPFFTTKEVGKGTGLGLSTVYGFVKQSGGIITCDSEPGKGTTFRLYFPAVGTPAAKPGIDEEATAGVRHGTGTILLVEDEEAVLRIVAETLEEAGYTVLQSAHPGEALAKLSEHQGPVDMLITDVVMPSMDGPTLAKEVTQLCPGIQVLYVSGYVGEELTRRGLAAVPDSSLLKPFSPGQLLDRLSEMLQHRSEQ